MAIRRQALRVRAAAAERGSGIEQHLLGLSVLLLALAVVVARAAA
jgi:hypothetical protein